MLNMAENNFVKEITNIDENFAQWYTDIVRKAELADYTDTKGCIAIRPYGYAIWENIQKYTDKLFKKENIKNAYFPVLIPESLLQKEKDHVEGFAPEVAWITHGGDEKLEERLCVRPTSETLFCDHFKNIVHSYRDLPKLYNQWCNVVRWEKTTRPFLRSREFLWQEGHTLHATPEEAQEETIRMLNVYAEFCENVLAIPVVKGQKTEKERFAGAEATYTIEALMHDGKALQSGTSHYFGDGFAKAFDITYTDKNNNPVNPFQTSWGTTTRLIGAVIMTHGDDSGLILPPKVAPVQAVIVPIASHKAGVIEKAREIYTQLIDVCRVKLDDSDQSPGWKFAEYEMKGVPVRIEIGPKDIANNSCVVVRRDSGEKIAVGLDELKERIPQILKSVHDGLYSKALERREKMTYDAHNFEELKDIADNKPGFIRAMWCGDRECEDKLKENAGVTSRCIPFQQEELDGKCVCCGKKAKYMLYWGKAY